MLIMDIKDIELKTKIKNRRKTWKNSCQKKQEFIGHQLTGEAFDGKNIFEMGLAYAEEERAKNYYYLSLAEAHPEKYTKNDIKNLEEEIQILNKKIRAFTNKQWPSRI